MEKRRGARGAGAGVIWFIGWLFTIGFANLICGKSSLASWSGRCSWGSTCGDAGFSLNE